MPEADRQLNELTAAFTHYARQADSLLSTHCGHWRNGYVPSMALWQFPLDLVPKQAATVGGAEAIRLPPDRLDEITLNLSASEETKLFAALAKLLPERSENWTTEIRFYGDEKSNDAHVSFDGSAVSTVQFRLDAGNLSMALIGGMCELARELDCVFVGRIDGTVIRTLREEVLRAVLQSRASRFVDDPQKF